MFLIPEPFSLAWDLSVRHPAIAIVFIAVVGEILLDWTDKEKEFARLKKTLWVCLIFGLSLEFREAAKEDGELATMQNETAQLNKEAGEARELAATTESKNLEQAKLIIDLQKKQGSRLERLQKSGLSNLLSNMPNGKVTIAYDFTSGISHNPEPLVFAVELELQMRILGEKHVVIGQMNPDEIGRLMQPYGGFWLVKENAASYGGLAFIGTSLDDNSFSGRLENALRASGFRAFAGTSPLMASNEAVIAVFENK